jgi:predicted PurR-regulated permease PerM
MTHSYTVIAYLIYLPIAMLLTWYVATTLFRNGLVFMRDIFFGREDIAKATNSLFKIGFYLLNLGFALYILQISEALNGTQGIIEVLSSKIGGFSIYLGVMLFFNLFLFFRGKKVSKQKHNEHLALQNLAAPAKTEL